jgi:hypothetical protein
VTTSGLGLLLLAYTPPASMPVGLQRGCTAFIAFTIAFLPFAAVGAFVAARRPRNTTGWLFCAIGMLSGASALATGASTYAVAAGWPLPAVVPWLALWGRGVVLQCLAAVLLVFPSGRLASPRWRPVAWLVVASLVADLAASAVAPRSLFSVAFLAPQDAPGAGTLAAGPAVAAGGSGAAALAGSIVAAAAGPLEAAVAIATALAVVWRLHHAEGQERLQLKWLAYSVVLATIAFAAHCAAVAALGDAALTPLLSPLLLAAVLIAGAPFAVAVAILRYRLYDIDWLITRTLVYGPLTAVLAGLYAAAITLFQKVFFALTGTQSDAAAVVSMLVLAAAFTPLKNALQAAVDARFKDAASPAARLRLWAEQVRADFSVVDPHRLASRFLDEAVVAIRAQGGAVYLASGGRLELVHAIGDSSPDAERGGAGVRAPLEHGGTRLGLLRLGPSADGRTYGQRDRDALQQAADAVAGVLSAAPRPAPR